MNDFLNDLYFYCLQKEPISYNLHRHRDYAALEELEKQIETAMGKDFWKQYSEITLQCGRWESADAFRSGLRFGLELILHMGFFTSS